MPADSWDALAAECRRLADAGDAGAAATGRRAVEAAVAQFGVAHLNVAVCRRELGRALLDERPSEAEPILRDALDTAERSFPADDPRIADYVHPLARALHVQGRLRDADEFYKRGLDALEMSYGPDALVLVPVLRDLARLRADGMGGWAEGEPLMHRAIEILETRVQGDLEPAAEWSAALRDLAATHLALGNLLLTAGLVVEAEKEFQKAVENLEACKVRGIAFRVAMAEELRKGWFESLQRRGRTTDVVDRRLALLGARGVAVPAPLAEKSFWMDFELAVEGLKRDGKDEKAIAGALAEVLAGKPLPAILDRDPIRTLTRGLAQRASQPEVRDRAAAVLGRAAGGGLKLGEALGELKAVIR